MLSRLRACPPRVDGGGLRGVWHLEPERLPQCLFEPFRSRVPASGMSPLAGCTSRLVAPSVLRSGVVARVARIWVSRLPVSRVWHGCSTEDTTSETKAELPYGTGGRDVAPLPPHEYAKALKKKAHPVYGGSLALKQPGKKGFKQCVASAFDVSWGEASGRLS